MSLLDFTKQTGTKNCILLYCQCFSPKNSQKKCLKFITKSIGDEGYNLGDKVVFYDQIFSVRAH